MTSDMAI